MSFLSHALVTTELQRIRTQLLQQRYVCLLLFFRHLLLHNGNWLTQSVSSFTFSAGYNGGYNSMGYNSYNRGMNGYGNGYYRGGYGGYGSGYGRGYGGYGGYGMNNGYGGYGGYGMYGGYNRGGEFAVVSVLQRVAGP